MTTRRLRRYVEDLLRGRRPRPFRPEGDEAADIRTAIELRAARPASGTPSEEFVASLHRRLAGELALPESGTAPAPAARPATRRRVVKLASVAASVAAVGAAGGAALDHALTGTVAAPEGGTLSPDAGTWRTVAVSADLSGDAVVAFDLGTVTGFVHRADGGLVAVSGFCTHQGCRLALNVTARELDCPCHNAAFTPAGQLQRHRPTMRPPAALPRLLVREVGDAVQVFTP